MSIPRRDFVGAMCAGGLAAFGFPTVRFARLRYDGRLVFVLLRGGFDGLASLVPFGDPAYASLREEMAFRAEELSPLDGLFGLAPGLSTLREFWDRGELAAIHAMAIPFRTRSHFDGQAVLETGLDRPIGSADGWLNRLLQVMEGERSAVAIASGTPRSLSGAFQVQTWSSTQIGAADELYLERLAGLYRRDRALSGHFEAALALDEAIGDELASTNPARQAGVVELFEATSRILKSDSELNVAALEFGGWDTHANQGTAGGALDRRLAQLSEGLTTLRTALGPLWASTTVVVMTEFGRTARINGSRGTDHGTAGAGFVLSPMLTRSRVLAEWPGLQQRNLFEGRDIAPTVDTRGILRGIIESRFDLTRTQADRVLPGSRSVHL